MKRLLKWFGILLGILVILIIAASIVVMLVVDKEMIASQMESVLNRHVTIDEIDIGLFSVVSGIEVTGVKISNYKSPDQLEGLKGKPVPEGDLFAGLKRLSLKIRFLPLLSGSVQVGEFVLYEPVIHVVKYKNGTFNFSDLLQPEPEEKKEEEKPSEPFSADDLPLRLTLGKVGLEQGAVTYLDKKANQTIQIYDLKLLAHSADIDPSNLEARNQVKIAFEMGIKPKERLKTGGVTSFDIGLAADGSVKPFDVKTRTLDPEVSLEVGSHQGTLTGLKIFETIQSVKALEQYTGDFAFLKDEVTWKEASADFLYKAGTAKISTGRIEAEDYGLDFAGATNLDTKALDLDLGLELGEKTSKALRSSIEKNMQKQLRGDVGKYVSAEKLADMVMKRLTNEEGNVFLRYKVAGTTTSPKPTLVEPTLPPVQALLKDVAGEVADIAKEAAKKEGQKAIDDATKQLTDQLNKSLRF